MAGTSSRGASLLTRRNKYVMVSLVGVLVCLIMLMNAGLFSSGPVYSGELCKVDDVEVQEDFDRAKFAGSWYGTYTKGMDNSLMATLLEFADVKVNFILKENGNYDLRSVGGKFYGMWCPEGEGHAEVKDEDFPQKLGIFFDTPTGKKFGTKPAWVVKTDYKSYGVVYSCWETEDGYCKAKSAYAVVLQRDKTKLPDDKMAEVKDAIARCCINPESIRPIPHKGYCKNEHKLVSRTDPV